MTRFTTCTPARQAAALSLLLALGSAAADGTDTPAATKATDEAVKLDGVEVTGVKSLKPPAVNVGNKSGLPLERVPQSVQVLSADDLQVLFGDRP